MRWRPVLVCALSAQLLLCGCEEPETASVSVEEKPQKQTTSSQTSSVEVKEYHYPEFANNAEVNDMLSNVINTGFKQKDAETSLEFSPFPDYICSSCLLGEYYTFFEDDFVGILNSKGTVILKPDKYAQAEAVSADLIRLSYPEKTDKKPDLFYVGNGFGTVISDKEAEEVTVVPMDSGDGAPLQYALSVRGTADEHIYDSIEEIPVSSIITKSIYYKAYKAVLGTRCYYLMLDSYCNITVCEAPYAQVRFKIGGEYGQCYILDGDDHTELMKMIRSFGSDIISVKPSKDESLDFIQIESGLSIGTKTILTMSPDGFCFTETVSEGAYNKYFAIYPKDTFVDLVNWVAEVIPKEYEKNKEMQ